PEFRSVTLARCAGAARGVLWRDTAPGGWLVVRGKVVRFDDMRGYGFVAPEGGGEDVFMHVNDLDVDKRLIAPGVVVEFTVEDGERGLKASGIRLVRQAGDD